MFEIYVSLSDHLSYNYFLLPYVLGKKNLNSRMKENWLIFFSVLCSIMSFMHIIQRVSLMLFQP